MASTDLLKRKKRKCHISYDTVAVIGCGSLGGYFADSLARATEGLVKTIILVDYTVVEKSNLRNSIYREDHVGRKKNEVLKETMMVTRKDIEIITIDVEFKERKTMLPECDLVFDCRDYVYDRFGQIDARLYLSGRHLIIDCRRVVTHEYHYVGNYSDILDRNDLAIAGILAARIISDVPWFQEILFGRVIFKESIDNHIGIHQKEKPRPDIIFDLSKSQCKILDLGVVYGAIRKANKTQAISVFRRSVENKLSERIIEKGAIRTYSETLALLESFVSFDFRRYSVYLEENDGKISIILLAETGGA